MTEVKQLGRELAQSTLLPGRERRGWWHDWIFGALLTHGKKLLLLCASLDVHLKGITLILGGMSLKEEGRTFLCSQWY